jgi:CRISPR/Cas system CMR subunit Cmr4 (Cas7 group RAMP superfamily)
LLSAFIRKAAQSGMAVGDCLAEGPTPAEVWLATPDSPLLIDGPTSPAVQLGEYRLSAQQASDPLRRMLGEIIAQAFADEPASWQTLVLKRTVLVHDNQMLALAERLDVRTRNAVGDDGTAANLWREECVPEDSVFHTTLNACPVDSSGASAGLEAVDAWLQKLAGHPLLLQLGGNASLGQGWMRLHLGTADSTGKVPA